MEFKKVFRGYDPVEVNKYISQTADKEAATRRAQKERIDELLEENINLRDRITELQLRQNDIADVLLAAQKVASEMEQNAKDYADKALFEAKKFYATWRAYSQTIVASFTDDELKAFSAIERKIGDVIANYERKLQGSDDKSEVAAADTASQPAPAKKKKQTRKLSAEDFVKQIEQNAESLTDKANKMAAKKSDKDTDEKSANPIVRIEQAAGQTIDLRELLRPEQSLEELCSDLGLIDSNSDEEE